MTAIPPLIRIRQTFPGGWIEDPAAELAARLHACGVNLTGAPSVAIAVGSRGITQLPTIVRGIVDWLRAQGARPFIVPAMGSHGGATAEGQRSVLAGYGVTEESVGAPVRASMDVVELPDADPEIPVWMDRHAFEADGTVAINRVKPHTSFRGRYESGLMKMCAIGLGKERQACELHRHGARGLAERMPRAARQVIEHGRILLGVAIVENAYGQPFRIEAMPGPEIPAREPALLESARARLARLPVDALDILIVDEIGKNISGVGMDTHVIGRLRVPGQPEPGRPRVRVIVARDLTEASHGNALGIGLADVTTRRLAAKIDWPATHANLMATTFLERGKLPVVAETDAQALEFAARACGDTPPEALRIARIRNTSRLDELLVSEGVLREIENRDTIEALGPCDDWFDGDGQMRPFRNG